MIRNLASTDFWTDCPENVLINISKNFDLKTRLLASQTCKRWNELLKDPRTKMEDVSTILLSKYDRRRTSLTFGENTDKDTALKILTDGLSNHIGKAKEIEFKVGNDVIILSRVSAMVNDGKLKIDKFTLGHVDLFRFAPSEWLQAILPSSINELDLHDFGQKRVLDCDWSLLSQLQSLTLLNISIDLSTTSPPVLKRLDMTLTWDPNQNQSIESLNTTLSYLSTLEELRISDIKFDDRSFRNFLDTIKNKLPNLRRLRFNWVEFDLYNGSYPKEFIYESRLNSLKEIEFDYFDNDNENWMMLVVGVFLRICNLDIIRIKASHHSYELPLNKFYRTLALINGNTKLELNLAFGRKTEMDLDYGMDDDELEFESITDNGTKYLTDIETPGQFGQTLTTLSLHRADTAAYLKKFFNCDSYENLTEINFINCDGVNNKMLEIISQSCPWLKKLHISSESFTGCRQITESGLQPFLMNWEERQSKKLLIELIGLFPINGLFGTSFTKGRGILGQRWMLKIDEDGRKQYRRCLWATSKYQKKSVDDQNQRYFQIYPKMFDGTRLVIWDERKNTLGNVDPKILVIKNYSEAPSICVNAITI